MITTTLFPGRYIQGADALSVLGEEMARIGKQGLVICDKYVTEHLSDRLRASLSTAVPNTTVTFGGECSDEEIARLVKMAKESDSDIVVGVGGGKTLDTAKAVAYEIAARVVVVPTLASTDAPCSALSVIYQSSGEFKRYLVLPTNPSVVLMDTELIAAAPARFLVSGMGDALATWFEAESCRKSFAANMTGRVGSMTAYSLARLCFETLMEHGKRAVLACEAKTVAPALEHVVEANTLLSGLGFESGGLAAAHAIHNGLTVLEETHHIYHGEKVAIGTLASLFLTDQPSDLIDQVFSFCESVGLPTTLADIGIKECSEEQLMRVAAAACSEGETIHNEPMPVTPQTVYAALRVMDREGTARSARLSPAGSTDA